MAHHAMQDIARVLPVLLLFSGLIFGPTCRADSTYTSAQNTPATTEASAKPPDIKPEPQGLPTLSLEQRGDVQLARGEYAAALSTYQRVQPADAVVDNKIGIAYNHLFALDAALKQYQLALKLNPRYAEAYNNEGAAYQGKLMYSAAIKAYKHALKLNNRLAPSYRNLGVAYVDEEKYSKATAAFRKALQIDPHSLDPDRPGNIAAFGTIQQRIEMAVHLAGVLATMRKNEQALFELKQACSLGFHDRKRLFRDPDLKLLRDTPEFHQFLVDEHLSASS
jgi:tetratricopeptide (TPR) repeat protein